MENHIHPTTLREVVFMVADLAAIAEVFQTLGGWRVATHGAPDERMRPSSMCWDSGGIFDLDLRVEDIYHSVRELRSRGWQALSEPVDYTFGTSHVLEVLALIQRVDPPLPTAEIAKIHGLGHVFNSAFMVRDLNATLAFYVKLGFKQVLRTRLINAAPGPHILALPRSLSNTVPADVGIISGNGSMGDSIEPVQLYGVYGNDYSARISPLRYGILAWRFEVSDLAVYLAQLDAAAITHSPSTQITLPPYGPCQIALVRGLDGEWLEVMAGEREQVTRGRGQSKAVQKSQGYLESSV